MKDSCRNREKERQNPKKKENEEQTKKQSCDGSEERRTLVICGLSVKCIRLLVMFGECAYLH